MVTACRVRRRLGSHGEAPVSSKREMLRSRCEVLGPLSHGSPVSREHLTLLDGSKCAGHRHASRNRPYFIANIDAAH